MHENESFPYVYFTTTKNKTANGLLKSHEKCINVRWMNKKRKAVYKTFTNVELTLAFFSFIYVKQTLLIQESLLP